MEAVEMGSTCELAREVESPFTESDRAPQLEARIAEWMLVLPFVFFSTRGVFSFLTGYRGDAVSSRVLAAAPTARNLGIVGYTVLPGIAYAVVLGMLLFNLRGVMKMAWENKALTLLAAMTVLSAVWSQNPARTLLNGSFYVAGTMFAYMLVLRFTPEEIMTLLMRAGVAVCILSALMIVVFPQYGVDTVDTRTMGAWVGIFPDRVSAAKCIVYLMSPGLVFGMGRRRWRNLAYVALLMVFVVMAKAVSALAVTFGLALVMAAIQISRRLERSLALLLGAFLCVSVVVFAVFGVPLVAEVLGMFGRDLTLTGRTQIWAILLDSIVKRPLLGYGFYAFWQGMTGESANVILAAHWFFGYAHNGLLEIVLQLGLTGTALFLYTFVSACSNAWFCIKYGRTAGIEWYTGILVLAVLYNIDEETVLWPNDLLSILYIVACCGLAAEARRIRAERALMDCGEQELASGPWAEASA